MNALEETERAERSASLNTLKPRETPKTFNKMIQARHLNPPDFLTQPIEELTPENDPESWARFQRAVAKWWDKQAVQDTFQSDAVLSDSTVNVVTAEERFPRYA